VVSRKFVAGAVILAVPIALCAIFRPDRAIRVATGLVAHNVCSKSFVSGLDPQTVFAETIDRAGIRRLRWGLKYHLDRSGQTVEASLAGLFGSRAAFHDGFGCALLHGPDEPYLLKSDIDTLKAPKNPPLLAEIAGAAIVEPSDPGLKAALDHAFEEPATPPFRRTKAVVVVHDGAVIAERYADGIGIDTAKAAILAPPGTRWAYSSPTTQLLARIIRDTVGGPEQTLAFAWRELFNPLGMRNVTLEFDATGTLQGSSYMLASARDWARFGLLYLNDGVIGGRRILHEDWVDFSAAATLDTDYGAGFWTNRSEHEHAKGRVRLGIPRDAFFASGDLGQRVVMLPSQHLVIVRLGDSVDPTGDIRGLGRLVKEVIAATQH
jgi:CubicO group peptidase (beta-lactamase class C family)